MRSHTLQLTDDQLKAVMEGLGQRIERIQADPRNYCPEELEAAKEALEKAADLEYQAAHPELAGKPPSMG